jgi:hypothetical protein
MSCSFCGSQACVGSCLNVAQGNGNWVAGQAGQTFQIVAQGGGGGGGGAAMGLGGYGGILSSYVPPPTDYSLNEFLEIIADKTDADACVTFVERQAKMVTLHKQMLAEMERQQKETLEKAEKEFLAKCQKYRPSITTDVLTRVKGLKAFY